MAQDFSKSFYQSTQWQDCRRAYIARVHGMCEHCLSKGKYNPGYIVHHKVTLTPGNINDPNITLNHEQLEYVCLDCHNEEHYGTPVTRDDVMFDSNGDVIGI